MNCSCVHLTKRARILYQHSIAIPLVACGGSFSPAPRRGAKLHYSTSTVPLPQYRCPLLAWALAEVGDLTSSRCLDPFAGLAHRPHPRRESLKARTRTCLARRPSRIVPPRSQAMYPSAPPDAYNNKFTTGAPPPTAPPPAAYQQHGANMNHSSRPGGGTLRTWSTGLFHCMDDPGNCKCLLLLLLLLLHYLQSSEQRLPWQARPLEALVTY
jgi:hypothetical protein